MYVHLSIIITRLFSRSSVIIIHDALSSWLVTMQKLVRSSICTWQWSFPVKWFSIKPYIQTAEQYQRQNIIRFRTHGKIPICHLHVLRKLTILRGVSWPRMAFTTAVLIDLFFEDSSDSTKVSTSIKSFWVFGSHSYLAGVTAAKLPVLCETLLHFFPFYVRLQLHPPHFVWDFLLHSSLFYVRFPVTFLPVLSDTLYYIPPHLVWLPVTFLPVLCDSLSHMSPCFVWDS